MNTKPEKRQTLSFIAIFLLLTSPMLIWLIGTAVAPYSSEARPHKHWYALTIGKHRWKLSECTTPSQRDNAEAYLLKPMPLILVYNNDPDHTHQINIHALRGWITLLAITDNTITDKQFIAPTPAERWTDRCEYFALLPGIIHGIQRGQHITLTKRHTQGWDY